ncbi:hypothetical protein JX266_006473 [Neoarthrinium moseri]|nr:hypothetical protein JX266_006473 [Neoarthrinium moseri]
MLPPLKPPPGPQKPHCPTHIRWQLSGQTMVFYIGPPAASLLALNGLLRMPRRESWLIITSLEEQPTFLLRCGLHTPNRRAMSSLPQGDLTHHPSLVGRLPVELLLQISEHAMSPATNFVRCVDDGKPRPRYAFGLRQSAPGRSSSACHDRAAFAKSHDLVRKAMCKIANGTGSGFRMSREVGWSYVLGIPWVSRRDLFCIRSDVEHGWRPGRHSSATIENGHFFDGVTNMGLEFSRNSDQPSGAMLVVPPDLIERDHAVQIGVVARGAFWLLQPLAIRRVFIIVPHEAWRAGYGESSTTFQELQKDIHLSQGTKAPFEGPSQIYYEATEEILRRAKVPEAAEIVEEIRRMLRLYAHLKNAWTVGALIGLAKPGLA